MLTVNYLLYFLFNPHDDSQADTQVDLVRQHFYEVSLEYVFKVQEVQERKMFEFVEPVSKCLCFVKHFFFSEI